MYNFGELIHFYLILTTITVQSTAEYVVLSLSDECLGLVDFLALISIATWFYRAVTKEKRLVLAQVTDRFYIYRSIGGENVKTKNAFLFNRVKTTQ